MIRNVSVRKGRFNWLDPQEYQVCITFYTDDKPVSTVIPLEDAEHLLYWDEDNPLDLLREVLRINKNVYFYSDDREKLEILLERCTPLEKDIEIEWLRKKQARLLEKMRNLENEVKHIEERIQCLTQS